MITIMNKEQKSLLLILTILMAFTLTACSDKKLDKESFELINKSIKSTNYTDFSFAELMDQVNIKDESVSIKDLDLTVSSDGYINTFNIKYFLGSSNIEYLMMYRRKSEMFKILETDIDNEYANQELNNKKILHILDGSFNLEDIERDDYDLYLVRLLSPCSMKSSHGDLPVYYNGMPIENSRAKNIEGLTFFAHTYPIPRDSDDFSAYIFDYN